MITEPLKNAVEPKKAPFYTKDFAEGKGKTVALFDFGAKANIQRELEKRGCTVKVVPYNTTFEQIKEMNVDGVMLSNGPGDPAENTGVIEEIKKLCLYKKIPIFGICLGHQMLALANGAKTVKLKYVWAPGWKPSRKGD